MSIREGSKVTSYDDEPDTDDDSCPHCERLQQEIDRLYELQSRLLLTIAEQQRQLWGLDAVLTSMTDEASHE